jgi:N-acetylmuramoyl-L-alanine amidase
MAARWVGLSRSQKKKTRQSARTVKGAFHECRHAIGAMGVLVMAAGMNFALYPDALAQVMSGERSIMSFVPTEFASIAAIAAPVEAAPVEVDETEVRLLAATMWGEARSEGEDGMRAVAHVMVNRIGPRFGETLSTVILSPRQFSVWNRGDPNRRLVISLVANPEPYTSGENAIAWERAQIIAREVLSGQSVDPTGGALFYHTRAVRPRWAPHGVGRQTIGQHIFYADVPDPGIRRTPHTIDIAQVLRMPVESIRSAASATPVSARGPRAGRVNGVIQYAPPQAVRQPLPSETVSDVNAAATPTIDGVAQSATAASATPVDATVASAP